MRLEKLGKIKELGINPYPERFERTHYSDEALILGGKKVREVDEIQKKNKNDVTRSGRLVSFRSFGKLSFGHLLDDKGKIQVCLMKGILGDKDEKLIASAFSLPIILEPINPEAPDM